MGKEWDGLRRMGCGHIRLDPAGTRDGAGAPWDSLRMRMAKYLLRLWSLGHTMRLTNENTDGENP
jgi:hypothetical protein